jgi:predicted phage terminase large subunit-like protein
MLEKLEDIAEGRIDRLMLLLPPGHAKSTYASVLFPAWWLARFPTSNVITACHTADLASHFARRVRALVEQHPKTLGVDLAKQDRASARWRTQSGGEYFATGIRGPITGRRADLVLIDDPIKSHIEADSPQARESLWNWYRSDLATRLTPGGRIVLVMTRWHEDDLGGRLIDSADPWTILRLPALAERNDPLGRPEGAPLWPEWEDNDALARRRTTIGHRVWQALYQQDPTPDADALFETSRIPVLDTCPPTTQEVRAWDLAATLPSEGRDPDWTVGLKLARHATGLIVTDIIRLRTGPTDVARTIIATASQDGTGVTIGLPQDPGQAGKQQIAWLTQQLAGHRINASPESGSKLTRATPAAASIDAGQLALLRAPWNRAFLEELRDFPQGRKDDQVDALSRAHALMSEPHTRARRVHIPLLQR